VMTDGAARAEPFGTKPRTSGSQQQLFDVENPREAVTGDGRSSHHRTDAIGRPSGSRRRERGEDADRTRDRILGRPRTPTAVEATPRRGIKPKEGTGQASAATSARDTDSSVEKDPEAGRSVDRAPRHGGRGHDANRAGPWRSSIGAESHQRKGPRVGQRCPTRSPRSIASLEQSGQARQGRGPDR